MITTEVPGTGWAVKLANPYQGVRNQCPSNVKAINLRVIGREVALAQQTLFAAGMHIQQVSNGMPVSRSAAWMIRVETLTALRAEESN